MYGKPIKCMGQGSNRMQHVLAELLLIASRSLLAGREHSILDITRERISGAFSGLR